MLFYSRGLAVFLIALSLFGLSFSGAAQADPIPSELVLTGKLSGKDHQTYVKAPFEVPEGVERITIEFSYTGKDQRTVVDLGLYDPNGLRGWSGGNKTSFTVARNDASPSYLPGPISPGKWHLLLGIPNIRKNIEATYTARVTFIGGDPIPQTGFLKAPIDAKPNWYRGDFHSHTGHSDGNCNSLSGKRIPCPAFRTLEAARLANLNFISVTEHNTVSHHSVLRELQAYYDTLLIIPGREITTFFGHMNAIGPMAPLEFQLGSNQLPIVDDLSKDVKRQGGIISINHPGMPSGEDCMGCGFVAPNVDYSLLDAVEIANGGTMHLVKSAEGIFSHIPKWESLLNDGFRLTGIGGSDNHDPDASLDRQLPVGQPATVVYAKELSQAGILDGVRSGRVFIDVTGNSQAMVDIVAKGPDNIANMGGVIALRPRKSASVMIDVRNSAAGRVELVLGRDAPPITLSDALLDGRNRQRTFIAPFAAKPYWARVNVRDRSGRLILISNPIYFIPDIR